MACPNRKLIGPRERIASTKMKARSANVISVICKLLCSPKNLLDFVAL